MKKFFAAVIALALIASPGAAFANGEENGNGPPNINVRNRNTNNIRNSNRNQNTNQNRNYNQNRNSNYNSNRNSNSNYNTNRNTNRNTNQQYQGQGQDQYQGQGQLQGQVGIVKDGDVTIRDGDTKVYAPAPSINPPALTSGSDVCMGSASVSASGGSGIIGLGFGFGKTYTDLNCVRLKNANALFRMGHKDAALALLANNDEVANALTAAGVSFAKIEKLDEEIAVKAVSSPSVMNDPQGNWGIDFEKIGE